MSMRIGTIVRFPDGRVAVKKLSGRWEVSGTTRERYRDEDLDEGYAVVYTPYKDVSRYGLGTIIRVGDEPFIKTSHGSLWGGEWTGIDDKTLTDAQIVEYDFIELYVVGE